MILKSLECAKRVCSTTCSQGKTERHIPLDKVKKYKNVSRPSLYLAHSYSRIGQSFIWNHFRMRTVHWSEIHIQCSMEAVFNVRVATPRSSVPSTVRKCAVPTYHLCSEISFSRTSNSPDLISYIYRIASVTLYCLYVYMVTQLHAH